MFLLLLINHEAAHILKEYGSNIQKLVENIKTIDDREQRTRYAHILVELMRQIHPNMRDGQDYYNKLWDDLYIMSGFTLDVDSPYPPPSPEVLGKPPQHVPYNTHHLKFKHFGRNMELLIAKAIGIADEGEKRAFVSYLFRLMKTFYTTWNKEAVEDETIFQSLLEMSNGKLADDLQLIREQGLVEGTPRERTGDQPQRVSNQPRNYGPPAYGNAQSGGNRNQGQSFRPNNNRNDGRSGNQNQRGRNQGPPYRPNGGPSHGGPSHGGPGSPDRSHGGPGHGNRNNDPRRRR